MHERTGDSDVEAATAEDASSETRKLYRRPQLLRLGTLADMTRTVGYRGSADGGRFPARFRTGTF